MSFHFRATQGWPSQERPEHVAPGWRARIWVARPTVSVVVVVCVAAVELAFFGYLIGTESTGGTERATEIQQSSFQERIRDRAAGRLCAERGARQGGRRAGGQSGLGEGRCGRRCPARRRGGRAEAGGDRGGRGSSGRRGRSGGGAGREAGSAGGGGRDTRARADPDSDPGSGARSVAPTA